MSRPFMLVAVAGVLCTGTAQTLVTPAPDALPWCEEPSMCSPLLLAEYSNTVVRGAATVRMGADGVFDRPVVLVEGFDFGTGWSDEEWGFGELTWSRIHGSDPVHFAAGLDYRLLLDDLHELGADLIFLDFEHGAASLQSKSALLTQLLTLVQEHKEGNLPGVIVGVSMGGVVARMALKQWENTGVAHCIGQYYSVDAPHRGATLPVGLQSLILGLSTTSETALSLWNALNSSAAHELVQHHIASNGTFQETQNDLVELGWPRRSLNFNVINSREGATTSFATEPLLHIEWGLGWPWNTPTCFVQAERWSNSESESTASFVLPGNLFDFSGTSPLAVGLLSFGQPMDDVESVAGSEARHVEDLAAALTESIPLPVLSSTIQPQATFIPYESALGHGIDAPSPWTEISTSTMALPREMHAALPPHHRNWMWSWMTSIWEEANEWNDIHSEESSVTLGWQQPRIRTIREGLISQQGQMVVGNSSIPFEAQTSPCEGQLLIESGGEFHVGHGPNVRGTVRIGNGTEVCVGSSGKLEIHAGSKLIVEQNGTLRLDGGKVVVHNGGTLIVEVDGQCVISAGSALELESSESLCMINGNYILLEGVELALSNRGTLQCGEGCQFALDQGSLFLLEQDVAGQMLLAGECLFTGTGKFHARQGLVKFLSTASIHAQAATHWEGATLITDFQAENHVISHAATTIDECTIAQIHWKHDSDDDTPALFKVSSCEWTHGICRIQEARIRVTDNSFTHTFVEGEMMASPSRFVGNFFEAPWYESCPSLRLSESEDNVWIEGNSWHGGKGLAVQDCNVVASCNTWQGCQNALQIDEGAVCCLAPSCGGGGNRFLENNTHIAMNGGALPVIGFGNNHIGHASNAVIAGETSAPYPSWVVKGASWNTEMLQNPWFSPFPSNLIHCTSGSCEAVTCYAQDMTAESNCGDQGGGRPPSTKTQPGVFWNVLGQEVNLPAHAVTPDD